MMLRVTPFFRYVFLLYFLVFTGCETVVDIDLPAHEPRLVVNGLFAPDSLWDIRLSASVAYSDTSFGEGPWVSDAVVEIWQGDTQIELLESQENGRYRGATSPVGAGDYAIRVSAPGWEPVEGRSLVPQGAVIESVEAVYVDIEDPNPYADYGEIEVTLTINDIPEEQNYFSVRVILELQIISSDGSVYAQKAYSTFATDDLALSEDGIRDQFYKNAYFTDDLFRDQAYELNFAIETFGRSNSSRIIQERYFVEFLTLSEDMYFYQISADRQRGTDQDPFTEPVDVYSNMSSGFGIFAGYHTQMYEIDVQSTMAIEPSTVSSRSAGRQSVNWVRASPL